MWQMIGILFDLGVGVCVLLGVVCVARRVLVGHRTRRWISTIEHAEVDHSGRSARASSGDEAPARVWDHVVQFYGHDVELVDAVGSYLRAAIGACESVVVVATAEHRRAFEVALARSGVDLASARANGTYIVLDAAETVAKLLVDGQVERGLFGSVVGQLMRSASPDGRPVRVYGEMVALLWDAGQINAAVELEGLWNELGSVLPFSLYCAYPTHSLTGAATRSDLEAICGLHADVVGVELQRDRHHLDDRRSISVA